MKWTPVCASTVLLCAQASDAEAAERGRSAAAPPTVPKARRHRSRTGSAEGNSTAAGSALQADAAEPTPSRAKPAKAKKGSSGKGDDAAGTCLQADAADSQPAKTTKKKTRGARRSSRATGSSLQTVAEECETPHTEAAVPFEASTAGTLAHAARPSTAGSKAPGSRSSRKSTAGGKSSRKSKQSAVDAQSGCGSAQSAVGAQLQFSGPASHLPSPAASSAHGAADFMPAQLDVPSALYSGMCSTAPSGLPAGSSFLTSHSPVDFMAQAMKVSCQRTCPWPQAAGKALDSCLMPSIEGLLPLSHACSC